MLTLTVEEAKWLRTVIERDYVARATSNTREDFRLYAHLWLKLHEIVREGE